MPVTESQIIEPGAFDTIQGDRVSGFACRWQELRNGTVSKPNTDQSMPSHRGVEPLSEICRVTSAP